MLGVVRLVFSQRNRANLKRGCVYQQNEDLENEKAHLEEQIEELTEKLERHRKPKDDEEDPNLQKMKQEVRERGRELNKLRTELEEKDAIIVLVEKELKTAREQFKEKEKVAHETLVSEVCDWWRG